ncbi:MAG: acyl-CoA dehydrogenase family protein [Ardenticatenales bacterium]|nr:acyl-CoA dehydrogenase family protein [Ardenticatenales bacterium]
MSLYFDEEQQMFREMVRRFVAAEVTPYVDEWEASSIL